MFPRFLVAIGMLLSLQTTALAQEPPAEHYVRAEVQDITEEEGANAYTVQHVLLKLLSGTEAGTTVEIENEIVGDREDLRMKTGQTVILQQIEQPQGGSTYYFQEAYRLPALLFAVCVFVALAVLIGRKRGAMSLLGLTISVGIIVFAMFPLIIGGWNVFAVSIVGSLLIAVSSILISHGYSRRTLLALAATCITLFCAMILAAVTVSVTRLFGLGSEESVFLQLDPSVHLDPKGLLLAGIIIGALGVLDDITTTQVAAIDEVAKANPSYDFQKLYRSGLSVGHEHIASMINTLALAYIGASLPLFLLFYFGGGIPYWVTLNSAFLAEEIVRTLVGSTALLLAIPTSTTLAAYALSNRRAAD